MKRLRPYNRRMALCPLSLLLVLVIGMTVGAGTDWARRRPAQRSKRPAAGLSSERSSKEGELSQIRREIEQFKQQLTEHEAREKQSRRNLSAFNKRTAELKATIARLESRMGELAEAKSEVDDSLRRAARSLDQLKEAYARSSRYLYMHGKLKKPDANISLFAPEKQSEYNRNSYYAHVIGEAHAMNRGRLDSMKQSLGESSKEIASTLKVEREQIGQRAEEANSVEAQKREEARQLTQIQQDKERLRRLLQQRMASAKRLEGMIASLVMKEEAARKEASEKKRALAEKRKTTHRKAPVEVPEPDEPVGRSYGPHSLSWPTSSHRVKQGFGEHRNATLNTVTMNLGIDIATPEGSPVAAAAEGEVSLVSSLPSYGTIVVLKHSGGLHTVYADLSGASVRAGSHVRPGQQIGRSGSNEENGDVVHFEVWKGKSKQNPMGWLR